MSGQESTHCSVAGSFYSSGALNLNLSIGFRQSQWTWYAGQTTAGPANSCAYHATCNATCAQIGGNARFTVGTKYPTCTLYESCADLVFTVNGQTTCIPGGGICAPSTSGPNGPCSWEVVA